MKKLYTEEKFKAFNHHRSKKHTKANQRSNKPKTNFRKVDGFVRLEAPKNFSFIHNTKMVLIYLDKVKTAMRSRQDVELDLSKVHTISPEAIVLLLAFIKSNKFRSRRIRGINPEKEECRNLILSSGFMDYVQTTGDKKKSKTGSIIYTETQNKVEPETAKEICVRALGFLYEKETIFSPLYEIIIECMANTNNHASLKRRGIQKWCLSFYYDSVSDTCVFCFVDLGIGIMSSVPRKLRGNILKAGRARLTEVDLFEDILDGNTFSRTNLPDRGKGIPLIYRHSQNSDFGRFIIVTNQIYSDIKRRKTEKMTTAFKGTFLFWELVNPNSEKVDKKGQYLLWKPKTQSR